MCSCLIVRWDDRAKHMATKGYGNGGNTLEHKHNLKSARLMRTAVSCVLVLGLMLAMAAVSFAAPAIPDSIQDLLPDGWEISPVFQTLLEAIQKLFPEGWTPADGLPDAIKDLLPDSVLENLPEDLNLLDLIVPVDGQIYVMVNLGGHKSLVGDLKDGILSFGVVPDLTITDANGDVVADDAPVGTGIIVETTGLAEQPVRVGVIIAGDGNGDGAVTLSDLVMAAKALRGAEAELTAVQKAALDLNKNGQITLSDLTGIVQILQAA